MEDQRGMTRPASLEPALPPGVARTALYMTLIRHRESERPDALFRDPFSAAVVAELAGSREMREITAGLGGTADSAADVLDAPELRYFPVRTRYFDDRLLAAMRAGIRQVASLAGGLDGRPLRLDCPPGTRWYEVDLPEMTEFKDALAARAGMAPAAVRIGVKADLTADWYGRLRAAGFDPAQPTVWLVEGLLMYLPVEAADRLLTVLTRASAAGSQLLLEHAAARMAAEPTGTIQDAVKAQNAALVSGRDDVGQWLADAGWRAEVRAGSDPAIGYSRDVPEMPAGWLAHGYTAAASCPGG